MSLGSSKVLIIKDFGDFHEIHGFPSNLMDWSSYIHLPISTAGIHILNHEISRKYVINFSKRFWKAVSRGRMRYLMVWTSLIVMIAPSDFMKLMDFNEILDYQGFPLISTTVVRYKASDKKKLKILRSEKIIFEFLVRNHPETTQNSPSCQIQHP